MHPHPLGPSGPPKTHPPRAAFVVMAIVLVAYFASLHVLIVSGVAPWLSVGLIVGPWVVVLATAVRSGPVARRPARALLVGATLLLVGLFAWTCRERLVGHVGALLYVENLVFLMALCGLFAVTLTGGREPLITRLARTARGGRLPPQAEGYTRHVTIVWATFFATMAAVSTLLFATQSRLVWSTFVNLLIWPAMAVLFAAEYAVRIRTLRDIPHVPMMSGIDAFRHRHADPVATASANE